MFMSESIESLAKLTVELVTPPTRPLNEYGEEVSPLIKSVDQKLEDATCLIKDAQQSLAFAKAEDIIRTAADVARLAADVIRDAADLKRDVSDQKRDASDIIKQDVSAAKDVQISQLKQDLKDSNAKNP
jgi:hypothetical protein